MAISGASFFMINIVFGFLIGNILSYERIRQVRRPVPRGIPIRPLDSSTIYRLSRRPTELNPDAEPIFLPLHNGKHRPLQVMERISTDTKKNWHRPKKDNFNVLNFEAYVMKPNNLDVMKPVTDRVLRDSQIEDLKPSPSSQRKYRTKNGSKNGSKKPKKNHAARLKEYDDLEFYRQYLEHQRHAAMVKKMRPKLEHKLPIGIEFFEQKKKLKLPYPPITYSPMYMNHLHQEAVEASNVQHVQMKYPDHIPVTEEQLDIQTTTPFIPIIASATDAEIEIEKLAVETIPQTSVQIPNQPISFQNEAESFHNVASEPEMYKFTIDDVVSKPIAPVVVKHPSFRGPVTLSPPSLEYKNVPNTHMMRPDPISPASANNVYENQFNGHGPYQSPITHQSNQFVRGNYRRFGPTSRFKNIPIDNFQQASASSHQQTQKFSIDPILMTTQMTIASSDENVAPTKNTVREITAKRIAKRNKKRRLIAEMQQFDNQKINRDNPNNLEFSSSYTKRRTQGYTNDEEPTTPISIKSKANASEARHLEMASTFVPKNEHHKFFQ